MKSSKVFAPISIGNLSVGFDSLGMALQPMDGSLIGDTVSIESSSETQLTVTGSHSDCLPPEPETNIVWHCIQAYHKVLQDQGQNVDSIKVTLEKNIPVSSGLGSSACSVVAAFCALNEYYDSALNNHDLLGLMAQLEGKISGSIHYDNIAPCFLGGLQLMTPDPETPCLNVPCFDGLYWLMAYPNILVSTKEARSILPPSYNKATTIEFGQLLAGFVAACFAQQKNLAMRLLKDVLAEPYRKAMLPGFDQAKEALLNFGCSAVGISGSGPTLFAVTDSLTVAEQSKEWLEQHYASKKGGFVTICTVDTEGARAL